MIRFLARPLLLLASAAACAQLSDKDLQTVRALTGNYAAHASLSCDVLFRLKTSQVPDTIKSGMACRVLKAASATGIPVFYGVRQDGAIRYFDGKAYYAADPKARTLTQIENDTHDGIRDLDAIVPQVLFSDVSQIEKMIADPKNRVASQVAAYKGEPALRLVISIPDHDKVSHEVVTLVIDPATRCLVKRAVSFDAQNGHNYEEWLVRNPVPGTDTAQDLQEAFASATRKFRMLKPEASQPLPIRRAGA